MSSKFIEQWLNDTLKECEHLDLPGALTKPEHKLPLSRYDLDRISLTNMKVPNVMVDRIYKSLFVHTVGFFELLQQATESVREVEKQHLEQLERQEQEFKVIKDRLEKNEQEAKQMMRLQQIRCDQMENEKVELEQEKMRIYGEFQKNAIKHEEEVQLRLRFESKLNQLHHINRELQTQYQETKDQLIEQKCKNFNLGKDLEELREEHNKLLNNNTKLDHNFKQIEDQNEKKRDQLDKYRQDLLEKQILIEGQKKQIIQLKSLIEKIQQDLDKTNQNEKSLSDYINNKSKEIFHTEAIFKDMDERRDNLEKTIAQKDIQIQRVKEKLRFYKSFYSGFEAELNVHKNIITSLRNDLFNWYKEYEKLTEDREKLQDQYDYQLRRYKQLDEENEQALERINVQNLVREDLKKKLGQQVSQLKKVFEEKENMYKNEIQLRKENQEQFNQIKDLTDERDQLIRDLTELGSKYEGLQEQFENLNKTLKQQYLNEKEARENYKNKFYQEQDNSNYKQKQIAASSVNYHELKMSHEKLKREYKNLKDELEQMTESRNRIEEESNDWFQKYDSIERQLACKTEILNNFHSDKKKEIKPLKQKIRDLQQEINYLHFIQEDFASDVMRWYEKYIVENDLTKRLTQEIKELNSKILKLKKKNDLQKTSIQSYKDLKLKLEEELKEKERKIGSQEQEINYCQNYIAKLNVEVEYFTKEKSNLQKEIRQQNDKYFELMQERDELMAKVRKQEDVQEKEVQFGVLPDVDQEIQTEGLYRSRERMVSQTNMSHSSQQRQSIANQSKHFDQSQRIRKGTHYSQMEEYQDEHSINTPQSQDRKLFKGLFYKNVRQRGDIKNEHIEEEDLYDKDFLEQNQKLKNNYSLEEIDKNELINEQLGNVPILDNLKNNATKQRLGTTNKTSRNHNLLFQISNRLGTAAFGFRDPVANVTYFGERSQSTVDGTSFKKQLHSTFYNKTSNQSHVYSGSLGNKFSTPATQSGTRIKKYIQNAIIKRDAMRVDFTNVEEEAVQRDIPEFNFYKSRLQPIDYKKIIAEGKEWTDPYFKPNIHSIYDETMTRRQGIKNWETFSWKRPSDLYGKGKYVVYNEITPTDILQGYCGNCYFLSALSSMAELPQRVKDIFITNQVNDAGCYAMHFWINGEYKEVVVDDYFPYDDHRQTWAMSRSSQDKEIWVMLVEKAWAKIFGSYQRIEAGTVGEALPSLTGAPTNFHYHAEFGNKKEDLWKMIKYADDRNFIIGTAVSSGRSEGKNTKDMQNIGLVDAHAYSLISVHEVMDQGKPVRLIKIRNPWGQKEWQGAWSDKSSKWTPELKALLGFENKNDGVFFISYEDYFSFFYITTICKWVEGSDTSEIADQHLSNGYSVVTFNISKEQVDNKPVVFSFNQIQKRFMDETMRGSYQYAPLKFMITKVREVEGADGSKSQEQVFLEGDYIMHQQAAVELPKLTAGEYVMFGCAEWGPTHQVKRLVYNIYAQDPIDIKLGSLKKYSSQIYGMMNKWLLNRIRMGIRYEVPVYGSLTEESDELVKELNGINLHIETAQQSEKVFYKVEQFNIDVLDEEHLKSREFSNNIIANNEMNENFKFEKNFYGMYIDVIRSPFHQPKSVAKPKKVVDGVVQKVKPEDCSGIDIIFKLDDQKNMTIDLRANNERDAICVENVDCPAMLIDLEISCSSLRQNIKISNMGVGAKDKVMREFIGQIDPETNSCFKYYIRPAIIYKGQEVEEQVHQEEEEEKDPNLIQQDEMESDGETVQRPTMEERIEREGEAIRMLEEGEIPSLDQQADLQNEMFNQQQQEHQE